MLSAKLGPGACVCVAIALALAGSCDSAVPPGTDGTPVTTTIPELRAGTVALGTLVTIEDCVVTSDPSQNARAFFVQDPEATQHGGLMVYNSNLGLEPMAPGTLVTLLGTYQEYQGSAQLVISTLSDVVGNGSADVVPAPVAVKAELVADAEACEPYESMLVRLEPATVTAVDAVAGTWTLDDLVIVDDFLYAASPFPAVGTAFAWIQGILYQSAGGFRLEPRSASDICPSP